MRKKLESIVSSAEKIVMIGVPLYILGTAFYRGLSDQPLVQGGIEEQAGLASMAFVGGKLGYDATTEDLENKGTATKIAYGTVPAVFSAATLGPMLTALFCVTGYMFGKMLKS